jgi:hypothetical protein
MKRMDTVETVREGTTEGTAGFLDMLAQKVGSSGASMVFGEPVERGGVIVIPVARAIWGFGGGSGPAGKAQGMATGIGGGGGVMITPIGYIELAGGRSSFRPIFTFAGIVPFLMAAGFVVVRILRNLRR